MEKLVRLIEAIRECVHESETNIQLDLPQIVVVGEQSSGKSSVLEAVVEREFFPKGEGIVTRRPLVLQLFNTTTEKEYGQFAHVPRKKFFDFSEIQQEIQKCTDLLLGVSQDISREPIFLKIFSRKVVSLTLIDLPGLTKIAVGTQPKDIAERSHNIAREYLSNPNSIILAVVPAITELATSDALKLVKEYDNTLSRTVGVLTKIDLMDRGTDCLSVLLNKNIPLVLGWVGVVNRNYSQVKLGTSLSAFMRTEREFFECHPAYRKISHRCGLRHLDHLLQHLLKNHIQKCLPGLRNTVCDQLRQCNANLERQQKLFGISSETDKASIIIDYMKEFTSKLREILGISQQSLELDEVSLGVSIQRILTTAFVSEYKQHEAQQSSCINIQTGMENAGGVPGFVEIPDVVIRSGIRNNVEGMAPCAVNVVTQVKEKLLICVHQSANKDCPYPNLNTAIEAIAANYVCASASNVIKKIQFFIECEKNHINFRHPDFTKYPRMYGKTIALQAASTNSDAALYKIFVEIDEKYFKYNSKNALLVIEGNNLEVFNDDYEQTLIGSFCLQDCSFRDVNENFSNSVLSVYHKSNKYLYKHTKNLDIRFQNVETMTLWKERLIELMLSGENRLTQNNCSEALLKIEKIKLLIDKYTQIVVKNTHDLLIKFCHLVMISGLENYLQHELSHHLIACYKLSELLATDHTKHAIIDGYSKRRQLLINLLDLIDKKFRITPS